MFQVGQKEAELERVKLQTEIQKEKSEIRRKSQLKKAEKAEAQACDKDQWNKAKHYSKRITEGRYLKQPKVLMLVETKKRKESMKMGDIASTEEDDEPDELPEGFHLQEQSPHCIT